MPQVRALSPRPNTNNPNLRLIGGGFGFSLSIDYPNFNSKTNGVSLMKDFIQEFYYGNIDPQARSIKQSKAVMKEMQTLNETEEYLTAKLKGEEKSKFLDHVNAWSVVNGESNLDSFIVGFRLGAKFTYDTFISNDAPFSDFLWEDN